MRAKMDDGNTTRRTRQVDSLAGCQTQEQAATHLAPELSLQARGACRCSLGLAAALGRWGC
jgi:hypothetical protein